MMTLKRFRVKNFRSIMDSGWIDCDKVTSLVGINESGKSNIILALWKLNPAREGKINLLHDMPAKEYSSWRGIPEQKEFITAVFELDAPLKERIVEFSECETEAISSVQITRRYDGKHLITFPNYSKVDTIISELVKSIVLSAKETISRLNEVTKGETGAKKTLLAFCDSVLGYISNKKTLINADATAIKSMVPRGIKWSTKSELYPQLNVLLGALREEFQPFYLEDPSNDTKIQQLILEEMPSFVYYSNYGNLDAQIYLPNVVRLLRGEKVPGFDNEAKVRTMRVLFDYVNLDPQEVLELGKDPAQLVLDQRGIEKKKEPTEEEIKQATIKKEERATLLHSASTKLTREFADWWKQGNYKFRLQADGDIFRIWVSDDKRPEEIQLEKRSTGLQWFLSFFLVFLVESQEAHKGAILLLDEAGLALHPMSQKDLVDFFDNLSETNQIIHTTHSPFLVNTTNIDRVKVVYSDENGYTVASSDLRAADDRLNEKSIYAVHAALGLSVSDILLHGCQPVIVEGPSDQFYLNAIKLHLIKNQRFTPNGELVFMPFGGGGLKGVRGIVGIVAGREGDLPLLILDSDQNGKDTKAKLLSGLYSASEEKILDINDYVGFDNSEIEDLIPVDLMERQLSNLFRDVEDESFLDVYDSTKPIVPQIEIFAEHHRIFLEKGWKVTLAKSVKQQLLKIEKEVPEKYIEKWVALFERFNV